MVSLGNRKSQIANRKSNSIFHSPILSPAPPDWPPGLLLPFLVVVAADSISGYLLRPRHLRNHSPPPHARKNPRPHSCHPPPAPLLNNKSEDDPPPPPRPQPDQRQPTLRRPHPRPRRPLRLARPEQTGDPGFGRRPSLALVLRRPPHQNARLVRGIIQRSPHRHHRRPPLRLPAAMLRPPHGPHRPQTLRQRRQRPAPVPPRALFRIETSSRFS